MADVTSLGALKLFLFTLLIPLILVEGRERLVALNEDNWDIMLEGEWMVEFFAPWCPACKTLQPVWNDFSDWSRDLNIRVGQVDVTISPGLSGRFMVTALPTIFHVTKGEFRQYRGGRDKESLVSFVEDKKWQKIDPVPAWKSPGSFQMSVVSWFFKLSTVLRAAHNELLEVYGLPTWGSYLIFAVATIFVGAFLGLVLVCIIDCIYPPKSPIERSSTLSSLKEELEGDEGDDLIDEGAESGADSQSESQNDEELSQVEEEEAEEEGERSGGEVEAESSFNVRKRRARKAD